VKLLDVNVLVYATDVETAHHEQASAWLTDLLSTSETVGIPTAVAIGFVRITTNPRVMRSPLDGVAAVAIVEDLLARPTVTSPAPTRRHYTVLSELLARTGTLGNVVSDAHLAALAIEHGAALCSYDRDFQRFPGLDWLVPGER